MTRAKIGSICLLFLCGSISVVWGIFLQPHARGTHRDFKLVYMATRCVLQGCDPYNVSEMGQFYQVNAQEASSDPAIREIETRIIYPPTIFSVIAPFAMLPWSVAHLIWLFLTTAAFFTSAYLIWTIAMRYSLAFATILIGFTIANCPIVFKTENAAGLAVSLCIIAVWCFLEQRFVAIGVVCMALSLAIKPHDAGLVWLFFLLAGGPHRKRALQTLLLIVLLSVPAIFWLFHIAPHWMQELHVNMTSMSMRGDLNDPGPASATGHTPNMIISLQTVFSVLWDEPAFYNAATYLVCAPLLLVWFLGVIRTRFSLDRALLAIASVVPLTMLLTYHRPYDAKLILLVVPAGAMLSAKGGRIAQWAFVLTTAAVFVTADLPLGMFLVLSENLRLKSAGLMEKILTILVNRPVPLVLLALGLFYLWVYLRSLSVKPCIDEVSH